MEAGEEGRGSATMWTTGWLVILAFLIVKTDGKTKSLDSSFGASHCGLTTRSKAPGGGSGAAALPGVGGVGKAQAGEDLQETQNR